MARLFRQRTRDEWVASLAGTDACVSPVLTFDEAVDDEHNRFRGLDGVVQPHPGEHATEILADWLGCPPAGSAT
jgi:alpha-methylacyl-CoA racemase